MEEVIQVLVFIVIITSVLVSKYKEVKANRPGQPTQRPVKEDYEESPDEEDVALFEETTVEPTIDKDDKPTSRTDRESDPDRDEEETDLFEIFGKFSAAKEVCPPSFIQNTPKHSFEQPEKHVNESSITSRTDILPKKKHKIRIKSRQEARQAFIYSEIFNRKYE